MKNLSFGIILLSSISTAATAGTLIEGGEIAIRASAGVANGTQTQAVDLENWRSGLNGKPKIDLFADIPAFQTLPATHAEAHATTIMDSSTPGMYSFSGTGSFSQSGVFAGAGVNSIAIRIPFSVIGTPSTVTIQLAQFNPVFIQTVTGFQSFSAKVDNGQTTVWDGIGGNNIPQSNRTDSHVFNPGSYNFQFLLDDLDNSNNSGTRNVDFAFTVGFSDPTEVVGFSSRNPYPPTSSQPGRFTFSNVPSGRHYDPPPASGYQFATTDGSHIDAILDLPKGYNHPFTITANGQTLGDFGPGDSVNFVDLLGAGVSSFTLTGIDPLVDSADSLAFPVQLAFDQPTASFDMIAVPEPHGDLILAIVAIARLSRLRRHRQLN